MAMNFKTWNGLPPTSPDTVGQLQRLLAMLQGQNAPEQPPEFETPYWQDIENLKWLSGLYMQNPGLRSNYLGNLMAYGMGGQAPFGSALPGGAINLPKLFITPPTPKPIELPKAPARSYSEGHRSFQNRSNDALLAWLQSGQSPTGMKTVYPWRPRVDAHSLPGYGQDS